MKTTIELPDELLREAKQMAHDEGVTLKELISAGLHAELERRRSAPPKVDFVFTTFGGEGLVPGVDPSMFREIGNEREWETRLRTELEDGQDAS